MRKLWLILLFLIPLFVLAQGPIKTVRLTADSMYLLKAQANASDAFLVKSVNGKVGYRTLRNLITDTTGWHIATKEWVLELFESVGETYWELDSSCYLINNNSTGIVRIKTLNIPNPIVSMVQTGIGQSSVSGRIKYVLTTDSTDRNIIEKYPLAALGLPVVDDTINQDPYCTGITIFSLATNSLWRHEPIIDTTVSPYDTIGCQWIDEGNGSLNADSNLWRRNTATNQMWNKYSYDKVGIGTSNPQYKLDVKGTVHGETNLYTGVYGNATQSGFGVVGVTVSDEEATASDGVYGLATGTSTAAAGIHGSSPKGWGGWFDNKTRIDTLVLKHAELKSHSDTSLIISNDTVYKRVLPSSNTGLVYGSDTAQYWANDSSWRHIPISSGTSYWSKSNDTIYPTTITDTVLVKSLALPNVGQSSGYDSVYVKDVATGLVKTAKLGAGSSLWEEVNANAIQLISPYDSINTNNINMPFGGAIFWGGYQSGNPQIYSDPSSMSLNGPTSSGIGGTISLNNNGSINIATTGITHTMQVITDTVSIYPSNGIGNLGKSLGGYGWDTTFTNNLKLNPDSLDGSGTNLGIDVDGNVVLTTGGGSSLWEEINSANITPVSPYDTVTSPVFTVGNGTYMGEGSMADRLIISTENYSVPYADNHKLYFTSDRIGMASTGTKGWSSIEALTGTYNGMAYMGAGGISSTNSAITVDTSRIGIFSDSILFRNTIPPIAGTADSALRLKYYDDGGITYGVLSMQALPTGGSGELMWADTIRTSTTHQTLATRYYADSVSLNVNHLYFDTIPAIPARKDGTFYYDSAYRTVALMTGKDITLQLGQEEHTLCRNYTSATITNGSPVYITGSGTRYPWIALADADVEASSFVLGIATQDIPKDSIGFITVRGIINDVNTTGMTVGNEIYLSGWEGHFTDTVPTINLYKVRLGRVLTVGATGKIYVRQIPFTKVSSLSDVSLSSTAINDALVWDGTKWVNRSVSTISAGSGVEFYPNARVITASSNQNLFPIETMFKTPLDSTEKVDAISVTAANSPLIAGAYLYNTALGRTSIDAGTWNFDFYCSVSSTGAGRVSSITKNIYRVRPNSLSTVTTTGTGTSRRCKASAATGKPFAADSVTPSATRTACSFVQTPKGLYQITAYNNDTSVTILVPSTYTNETGVALSTWKLMFGNSTGTITNLTTNYGLYATTDVRPAYTFETKDKIGKVLFGVSNNTTTVNYVYQGTSRYSKITTPLAVLHDNLAGLNAGNYQHLTTAEKAILDTTTVKTGLATNYDLLGKASTSHTQAISTITGLQDSITNHYTKTEADNKFQTFANLVNVTGTSTVKYATQNLVKSYADSVTVRNVLYVGSTRDYTTIQSAINAASIGTTIIIDVGSYTETITNLSGKNNLRIVGSGVPCYTNGVLSGGAILTGCIRIDSCSGVSISNIGIKLDGTRLFGLAVHGIRDTIKNVSISNIIVVGNDITNEHGITIEEYDKQIDGITIRDCRVYHCPYGIGVKGENAVVSNCYVKNAQHFGFWGLSDNAGSTSGTPTYTSTGKNISFLSCRTDSTDVGFNVYTRDIQSETGTYLANKEVRNVHFTDCSASNGSTGIRIGMDNNGYSYPKTGTGTSQVRPHDVVISGFTAHKCTDYGIDIREGNGVTINGGIADSNGVGFRNLNGIGVQLNGLVSKGNTTNYSPDLNTHILAKDSSESVGVRDYVTGKALRTGLGTKVSSQWTTNGSNIYFTGGNVGIGVTAPTADLSIEDPAAMATLVMNTTMTATGSTGTTTLSQFDMRWNGTAGDYYRSVLRRANTTGNVELLQSLHNSGGSTINFMYVNLNTYKFEMQSGIVDAEFKNTGNTLFSQTGNVGIGTTSPTAKLHVNGAIQQSGTDTTGVGSTAHIGTWQYYNGHFYGLIPGSPNPTWKQLDN